MIKGDSVKYQSPFQSIRQIQGYFIKTWLYPYCLCKHVSIGISELNEPCSIDFKYYFTGAGNI